MLQQAQRNDGLSCNVQRGLAVQKWCSSSLQQGQMPQRPPPTAELLWSLLLILAMHQPAAARHWDVCLRIALALAATDSAACVTLVGDVVREAGPDAAHFVGDLISAQLEARAAEAEA